MARAGLLFIALAASLAGCASPSAEDAMGRAASPIIGGTPDNGDPAVVLLISYPQDQSTFYTCTAEVIAPTVLLTAAHCVDAPNHPGFSYGVFLGEDATGMKSVSDFGATLLPVASAIPHPMYDANAPDYPADIGVVVLASPLQVTPLPINVAPLDATIAGTSARIVGYGETVYQKYNASKYQATTTVEGLGADGHTVIVGDNQRRTCVGDSGGPALVSLGGVETIIGTDSFTPTTGCIEPAHFQRVDVYQSFVTSYLSGTGGSGGSAGATGGGGSSSSAPEDSSSGGCTIGVLASDDSPWILAAIAWSGVLRRRYSARYARLQAARAPSNC